MRSVTIYCPSKAGSAPRYRHGCACRRSRHIASKKIGRHFDIAFLIKFSTLMAIHNMFHTNLQRNILCQNQETPKKMRRKKPRKLPKRKKRQSAKKRINDGVLKRHMIIEFFSFPGFQTPSHSPLVLSNRCKIPRASVPGRQVWHGDISCSPTQNLKPQAF